MLGFINRIIEWFKSLFWKEEMELTLVGLQNSGKTTFVNVIAVSRARETVLNNARHYAPSYVVVCNTHTYRFYHSCESIRARLCQWKLRNMSGLLPRGSYMSHNVWCLAQQTSCSVSIVAVMSSIV